MSTIGIFGIENVKVETITRHPGRFAASFEAEEGHLYVSLHGSIESLYALGEAIARQAQELMKEKS